MADKEPASVLIADLDDTLLDWLRFWYDPFSVLLEELHQASGVSVDRLKKEFRRLHQRHGTSEASWLLGELPSLQKKHPDEDIGEVYDSVLHAYYSERLKHFDLFPGVRETLQEIRRAGSLIVVFTESRDFYARERIRRLGLDGLVDILYSPPDHPLPTGFDRYYPEEHYELVITEHRHLHYDFKKPNREILLEILHECHVEPEDAIYVGDSEMKDVQMAQAAGVRDVYAAYAKGLGDEEYNLLQDVSHWTDEDMRREERLRQEGDVDPTYTLNESFSELTDYFTFSEYVTPIEPEEWFPPIGTRGAKLSGNYSGDVHGALEAWKKTVDVQQHFNDLEMRIRNIALSAMTAVLGAAAFAYHQGLQIQDETLSLPIWLLGVLLALIVSLTTRILTTKRTKAWLAAVIGGGGIVISAFGAQPIKISVTVSVASLLAFVGMFVWFGFYFMDRGWYHHLLYGAVKHGEYIEERLRVVLPEARLTKAIGRESPIQKDRLNIRIRSKHKMDLFYLLGGAVLFAVAVLL